MNNSGDAMNSELNGLEENGTWYITTLPSKNKAIGCKWLYKTRWGSGKKESRKLDSLYLVAASIMA